MPISKVLINAQTIALAAMVLACGMPALAQTTTPVAHKAHRHHHHASKPAPSHSAAASVTPPAALPGSPAPVPDENATGPTEHAPQTADVSPSVMQLHYPNVGNGYIPGSSPQAMDDLRAAKAGGVEVTMPLQPPAPPKLPPPTQINPAQ